MTLFGNRVIANGIIDMKSSWSRMGPYSNMTGVLIRKGEETQGEYHVMREAETGVMHLHANEYQELLTMTRN